MAITIQLRHGTAAQWFSTNRVLEAGEAGVEIDTGRQKLGNGVASWNSLPYAGITTSSAALSVTPTTYVIPLDVVGAGKYFATAKIVDTNATLSVDVGAVAFGNATGTYRGDGIHSLGMGPFINGNGYTFLNEAGRENNYLFVQDPQGNAVAFGYAGKLVGATPPTLVSATVSDTDAMTIHLTWSRGMNSAVSAPAAFAVSSAHAVVGHVYIDATHSDLSLTTPFTGTESAKTLGYTVPGSNPMQDLSSTAVVTFTGAAITNGVTNPTLLSASVSNSTPTKIDLTWSKAMNTTVSASSTFAVSAGHTLTAHANVDSTHTQLTTSAAFVAGETKTLAYTPSGTNDMKDSVGGNLVAAFSGTAITDNVGGTVIMEDNLGTPSSGTIDAHTPNVSNAGGLNWVDRTAGNMTFIGGSLAAGDIIGFPYAADGATYAYTGRKNYTLEVTALIATSTSPDCQMDVYVRDTGASTVAAANAYRVRVDPFAGNITVNQITAGVAGSTLATITTAGWAGNAITKLGLVMDGSDNMQVQVAGSNVGSPIVISGASFGFRIASTGRGAPAVYFTYCKAS